MRIPRRELLKLSAMATAGTVIGCNDSGEGELTLEENGFNIIDVEPTRVTVRSFRFDGENDDPEIIDTLEPFRESVFERG